MIRKKSMNSAFAIIYFCLIIFVVVSGCSSGYYGCGFLNLGCCACNAGTGNCQTCPVGTYASGSGWATCSLCSPGSYAPFTGSTSCTNCSPGSFAANSGWSICGFCQPGTYSSGYGSTTCSPCPAGTFGNAYGLTACTPCPAGQRSAPGASQGCSMDCPVGSMIDISSPSKCDPCPLNTFGVESSFASPMNGIFAKTSNCLPCPTGYTTRITGAIGPSTCYPPQDSNGYYLVPICLSNNCLDTNNEAQYSNLNNGIFTQVTYCYNSNSNYIVNGYSNLDSTSYCLPDTINIDIEPCQSGICTANALTYIAPNNGIFLAGNVYCCPEFLGTLSNTTIVTNLKPQCKFNSAQYCFVPTTTTTTTTMSTTTITTSSFAKNSGSDNIKSSSAKAKQNNIIAIGTVLGVLFFT